MSDPDDDIDWLGSSSSWLAKNEAEKASKTQPEEDDELELLSARTELRDALEDCVDLDYVRRGFIRVFLSRHIRMKASDIQISDLDLATCEKALKAVYKFMDRKLAVEKILDGEYANQQEGQNGS